MKKLLVLAVVVFGAVMAQALACSWKVSYSTTSETASKWANNGAVAMAFAGTDMKDVLELVGSKTVTDLKSELETKTLRIVDTDMASSVAITANGTTAETATVVSTLLTDETLFVMFFTDGNFTADTEVYWLGSSRMSSGWIMRFTNSDFVSATIGEIREEYSSVPEPGVMGLLALGVGALALRRKVARA